MQLAALGFAVVASVRGFVAEQVVEVHEQGRQDAPVLELPDHAIHDAV